eukprot:SAG31_NODE_5_length_43735_cov_42.922266_6_plen_101_part_00
MSASAQALSVEQITLQMLILPDLQCALNIFSARRAACCHLCSRICRLYFLSALADSVCMQTGLEYDDRGGSMALWFMVECERLQRDLTLAETLPQVLTAR